MFEGAYTGIVTPFNRDGAVDYGRLRALIDLQAGAGIDGIVPVGTTGESPSLTVEEHERVIAVTVEACRGRMKVIGGTGANSPDEAIELTRAASSHAPFGDFGITRSYSPSDIRYGRVSPVRK